MNESKKKTRRRYGAELKQQILVKCAEPGASVASIALSHGIDANTVHKWRRQSGSPLPALQAPAFVPVTLRPAPCAPAPDIRIELRRSATTVSVTWPVRAGQRAAAVMSLIQSARMNGHDLYVYMHDVMTCLPMQRASQIGELPPHRWQQL